MSKEADRSIYLDYAAATPTSSVALSAMEPYWQEHFANAQSTHRQGQTAREAMKKAREQVAKLLSVQKSEIVFTSGATEANSLATLGVGWAFRERQGASVSRIAASSIAHSSVRDLAESFPNAFEFVEFGVGEGGQINVETFGDGVDERVAVVSISHINSEVGTIQPVRKITQQVREVRGAGTYPLVHLDASQSMLEQTLNPEALGVDLLTLNPGKWHGPKGVGVLWVRGGTPLAPITVAGTSLVVGDYQKVRAGTPATPLIVGAVAALLEVADRRDQWKSKLEGLREFFAREISSRFPGSIQNAAGVNHAAHILSITFPDVEHDFLTAQLNARGIAVSATSACQAQKGAGSVLEKFPAKQNQAVRFSFSHETTREELEQTLMALEDILA